MSKVVIIGGGASGVIAALSSKSNDVTIIESNDKILKKLLLTGNGKCNYWNEEINDTKFQTDDYKALNEILKESDKTLEFLYDLGLYPKIKKGYYYPYSNTSTSVREIFLRALLLKDVKIITNFKVDKITYDKKFNIYSNNLKETCDKLIISCGSMAYPRTGSDGSGYELSKIFNHTINKVTPALVPLKLDGDFLSCWDGVRCDVKVDLLIDKKIVGTEIGEAQLTNYGISGICIFNLSGLATKNLDKDVKLKIDFIPDIDNLYEFLENRSKNLNNTLEEMLESLFNYRLMFMFFKITKIDKSNKWCNLKEEQKLNLINTMKNFKVKVIGSLDYDRAQTCTGGIPLSEINPKTMESKIVKNLYLTGEILDVTGKCGGYNLAFSFITGKIAGENCDNN